LPYCLSGFSSHYKPMIIPDIDQKDRVRYRSCGA